MSKLIINDMYLSHQLGNLPDLDAYVQAASACLLTAIGGDVVGLNHLDFVSRSTRIWFDPPDAAISEAATSAVMDRHPLVRRYVERSEDTAPCKISDLLSERQWRSHSVYSELFVPMGARHQLGIVTYFGSTRARAWAINRSGRDFDSVAVTMAAGLQPILGILDRIYLARKVVTISPERQQQSMWRAGLTSRELDMLIHLANGLSAQQIATICRISVRTVRKHLENVYTKLNCHDRVAAINAARHLGLL